MAWHEKLKRKPKKLEGCKFGKLTAISRFENVDKNKHYRWLCKCECGSERIFYQTHLIRGNTKSCGCERTPCGSTNKLWGGYGEISGAMWKSIERNANGEKTGRPSRKLLSFTITIDQAWNLFIKQERKCNLTGIELVFGKTKTASLDRIDSTKGYDLENVQWVHKDVNRMKNIFSNDYFIEICKRIAENN